MLGKKGRWLLGAFSIMVVSLFAWVSAAASPSLEQGSSPISTEITVGITNDTVLYSVLLKNSGSTEIGNVFLASLVPAGATDLDGSSSPADGWFRGFEGLGAMHAAVWLVERVPANGTAGPFIYRVNKGQTTDLSVHTWVRWLRPSEGTYTSPAVNPSSVPAYGTALEGRFHDIHTVKLGLKCSTCHVQKVEDYQDPMAQTSNLADRAACLSCHTSGNRAFFGEGWKQSSMSK